MPLKEEAYKEVENLVNRFEEQLPLYRNLIKTNNHLLLGEKMQELKN